MWVSNDIWLLVLPSNERNREELKAVQWDSVNEITTGITTPIAHHSTPSATLAQGLPRED